MSRKVAGGCNSQTCIRHPSETITHPLLQCRPTPGWLSSIAARSNNAYLLVSHLTAASSRAYYSKKNTTSTCLHLRPALASTETLPVPLLYCFPTCLHHLRVLLLIHHNAAPSGADIRAEGQPQRLQGVDARAQAAAGGAQAAA